ncbi:MAG: FKBP-type peptidyl-prolyl cis-trans isomerase [Brevinemataceae bacterium]
MPAKNGDVVFVHYKGFLNDGSVFDSSEGRDPLSFVVGQGHVIPGFEAAAVDMEVGESKTVHIPCKDAYGEFVEEAQINIPVGQTIVLLHPETGEPMPVKIVKAENGVLTIDGNHPLAGQDLNFEIVLESIGEVEDSDSDCECSCGCSK